jgi:recombination protein RecR
MKLPKDIQSAIEIFSQLPSIGPRAAERIVLYLLKRPQLILKELEVSLKNIEKHNQICQRCFNIAEGSLCPICQDKSRESSLICVVEDIPDLLAIENKNIFKGVYHVLGGTARIGRRNNLANLKIEELKARIPKEKIKEVIIATNPTTEGDVTAVAIKEALQDFKNLKITRIGRGMPTGGDIEYADPETILGSFKSRNKF